MSRGPGRIEQEVLALLREGSLRVRDLCWFVYHEVSDQTPETWKLGSTPAQRAAISRAIASLRRRGEPLIRERYEGETYFRHSTVPSAAERVARYFKDEERRARRRQKRAEREARKAPAHKHRAVVAADRERLAKLLGMLGSEHQGERDAAARQIEMMRQKLGGNWQDVLGRR